MNDGHGPWGPERPAEPPPRLRDRLSGRLPRPRPGLVPWLLLLAFIGGLGLALAYLAPGRLLDGGDGFEVLRLVGLAALVSSGVLATRRMDVGRAARHAATWLGIGVLLVLGYADRQDILDSLGQLRSALAPAAPSPVGPGAVAVTRAQGGGFYVMGEVNDVPVRFLIDTGSSEIVLAPQDAARARLRIRGPAGPAETANGVGGGEKALADSLAVGPIRLAGVPVFVNKAPLSVSLLGLTFLDRLESYEARGDTLTLRGKATP